MAFFVQLLAIALSLCSFSTAWPPGEIICNANPYGQPNTGECWPLVRIFADERDDAFRIFDEEQLREDGGRSWPGIINPFKSRVVQVPRYWTKRRCRLMAIMLDHNASHC